MDLIFRLSQDKVEGFENIEKTKKFFSEILPKRDKNYFFHTKKMNKKKLQKGDTIYFSYDNYIVAKAKFMGEIKTENDRNEKFIHGHKITEIEIINSNIQLDTKIVSTRTTYIDNIEKKDEIERVLNADVNVVYPDEIENQTLFEGAKKQVIVNAYERNQKARRECIKYYGTKCFICGFDFEEKYGEIGKGFIHIHHVKPLSEINDEYEVNPIEDLRPVCPNCHAMIHKKKPAYSIEEIQSLLAKDDL